MSTSYVSVSACTNNPLKLQTCPNPCAPVCVPEKPKKECAPVCEKKDVAGRSEDAWPLQAVPANVRRVSVGTFLSRLPQQSSTRAGSITRSDYLIHRNDWTLLLHCVDMSVGRFRLIPFLQ